MIPEGNPNHKLQNKSGCCLEAISDAWLLEVFIALKTSLAWQKFLHGAGLFCWFAIKNPTRVGGFGNGLLLQTDISLILTPLPIPQSSIFSAQCCTQTQGKEGGSCEPSVAQRPLQFVQPHYPTTAGSAQFCLLCCQPEPFSRSSAARMFPLT